MTREEWLEAASRVLWPLLPYRAEPCPALKVSVGFPKGGGGKRRRLGQCWGGAASVDGSTFHIFISPEVSEPLEVMRVLLHELCHVWAGVGEKHKGAFIVAARSVGLTRPWSSTPASEGLAAKLEELRGGVGGWEGVGMIVPGKKPQASRLRLWECPHGQKVRAASDELDVTCNVCRGAFVLQSGGDDAKS